MKRQAAGADPPSICSVVALALAAYRAFTARSGLTYSCLAQDSRIGPNGARNVGSRPVTESLMESPGARSSRRRQGLGVGLGLTHAPMGTLMFRIKATDPLTFPGPHCS